MKVVSINAEQTLSPQEVALNVDEDLTPEFIAKIEFGSLKFRGAGRTLVVLLPSNEVAFNARALEILNERLKDISDEYAATAAKRQQMLQSISASTGLKLD